MDFKFQTGYSTWARSDLPQFKFYNIDRATNKVVSEAPLKMDLASNDKFNKIKEQLDNNIGCRI